MSKTSFGTGAFTGLDVSRAPHLIDSAALTQSCNGWTEKEGAVSVAKGRKMLYDGYSAISCFAAGRQGGSDKVAFMDGNNVYINGGKVGEITAGTDMHCRDFNDSFYFMGSTSGYNYLYDGNLLRQHGPWQLNSYVANGTYVRTNHLSHTIAGITLTALASGTTTVITVGTTHGVPAGGHIYLDGITTGPTEMNGNVLSVTAATATTLTVEYNSYGLTAWSAGGTVYEYGCGLSGSYKYYAVPIVRFDSTLEVIEGKPRGVIFTSVNARDTYTSTDTFDALEVSLSPEDEVIIELEVTPDFSPTTGTTAGLRLYRTKANGSEIYLEYEWWVGDTNFPGSGGTYSTRYPGSAVDKYRTSKSDIELGAVYLGGFTDYDTPPAASLMALVGQRLFMNDTANPDRLYFSLPGQTDYVPTLNYLTFPDTITGIGSVGTVAVVFSCDRMWRVSLLGGIPDVDEIETPVGTTYGKVMTTNDMGLMFLRKDGLWVTDGNSPPQKMSRVAFSSINTPTALTAYGDTLYVGDSNTGYVMRRKNGGMYWHEYEQINTLSDATNGKFYSADGTSVFQLFEGPCGSATIKTKDISNPW